MVLPPSCKGGECETEKLLKMDEQLNNKLGSETTSTDNNLDKSTGGISVEVGLCNYISTYISEHSFRLPSFYLSPAAAASRGQRIGPTVLVSGMVVYLDNGMLTFCRSMSKVKVQGQKSGV